MLPSGRLPVSSPQAPPPSARLRTSGWKTSPKAPARRDRPVLRQPALLLRRSVRHRQDHLLQRPSRVLPAPGHQPVRHQPVRPTRRPVKRTQRGRRMLPRPPRRLRRLRQPMRVIRQLPRPILLQPPAQRRQRRASPHRQRPRRPTQRRPRPVRHPLPPPMPRRVQAMRQAQGTPQLRPPLTQQPAPPMRAIARPQPLIQHRPRLRRRPMQVMLQPLLLLRRYPRTRPITARLLRSMSHRPFCHRPSTKVQSTGPASAPATRSIWRT